MDSAKTNGALVSFGYDGTGRRVRKTVGSAVYKYVYDGDQILTIDSLGTRVRTYSYYPGVDQPHSVITSAGNRYYYLSEVGAGSVWGVIDTVGGIKNRYQYAPFGASEVTSELVGNPFRYTGREYDSETQLYFYRSRYYDPSLARFISEDLIGQNGGINQYAYASNNPVNRNDPAGMDDGAPDYVGNPRCDRVFYTDGGCDGGAGGYSSNFGDMFTQGSTSFGYATDMGKSWDSWEHDAVPAGCSDFDTEECTCLHDAIGQLQKSSDGQQCNALGNDADSRLKDGTMFQGTQMYRNGKAVDGAYFNPADMEPDLRGIFPRGAIQVANVAFRSHVSLFETIAHEEAHAVFGLPDAFDKDGNEILDSRNPAQAVAETCQAYNH